MTEETLQHSDASEPKALYRNKLVLFISGSIVVALLLVAVAMALYASSGAAQLDLSRPGYKAVQDKVDKTDTFKSFSASGSVDDKTLDQFRKLYDEQVQRVTTSDAFNPDVLSDQALGIDDSSTPTDASTGQ